MRPVRADEWRRLREVRLRALAWAIGREYAGLILGVMADNGGAQAAYRSMGFTEYDRITEPSAPIAGNW